MRSTWQIRARCVLGDCLVLTLVLSFSGCGCAPGSGSCAFNDFLEFLRIDWHIVRRQAVFVGNNLGIGALRHLLCVCWELNERRVFLLHPIGCLHQSVVGWEEADEFVGIPESGEKHDMRDDGNPKSLATPRLGKLILHFQQQLGWFEDLRIPVGFFPVVGVVEFGSGGSRRGLRRRGRRIARRDLGRRHQQRCWGCLRASPNFTSRHMGLGCCARHTYCRILALATRKTKVTGACSGIQTVT